MRVLVCGGRGFRDGMSLFVHLDGYHSGTPITLIIEGGQRTRNPETGEIEGGADYWAQQWAISRHVKVKTVPADWDKYGRAAGPIRNQEMLDEERPDWVLAYPGGRGTADMVRRAKAANVKVIEAQ